MAFVGMTLWIGLPLRGQGLALIALRGEVDVSKSAIPTEIEVAMVVWRCYSRHDFVGFSLTYRVHALITITLRFPMA